MQIFGVTISQDSRQDILVQVDYFFSQPQFHRIATVNPEFLVLTTKDSQFKRALLSADLCVADGIGIVLVGQFLRKKVTRFPGADLMKYVLTVAEQKRTTVYLALRKDGLSTYKETKKALLEQFPELLLTTNLSHAEVVLCSYGAPEQEIYLESLRAAYPHIRLAMGVGGSFDYLTGKQRRAPQFLRVLGLEWLWRLILQPKRFKRICTAIVIFPLKALLRG